LRISRCRLQVLPRHFRHSKLTSFQRQLNLYGFQRIVKGTEAGRYQHPLFERGRPELLSGIKRESRVGEDGAPTSGAGKAGAANRRGGGSSRDDGDGFLYASSASKAARQAGMRPGGRSGTRSNHRSQAAAARNDALAPSRPQASVSAGGSFVFMHDDLHDGEEDNEDDENDGSPLHIREQQRSYAGHDDDDDNSDDDGGGSGSSGYVECHNEGARHHAGGSYEHRILPSRGALLVSAAAPEDHTAALAMLNISRSLSAEAIRAPTPEASSSSSSGCAGGGALAFSSSGCAGGADADVNGRADGRSRAELLGRLEASEAKARVLEGEVARLKAEAAALTSTIHGLQGNQHHHQAGLSQGSSFELSAFPALGPAAGSAAGPAAGRAKEVAKEMAEAHRADSPGCSSDASSAMSPLSSSDRASDHADDAFGSGDSGKRRHDDCHDGSGDSVGDDCHGDGGNTKALGHALRLRRSSSASSAATDSPDDRDSASSTSSEHPGEPLGEAAASEGREKAFGGAACDTATAEAVLASALMV